jgi:hypothetical protein
MPSAHAPMPPTDFLTTSLGVRIFLGYVMSHPPHDPHAWIWCDEPRVRAPAAACVPIRSQLTAALKRSNLRLIRDIRTTTRAPQCDSIKFETTDSHDHRRAQACRSAQTH